MWPRLAERDGYYRSIAISGTSTIIAWLLGLAGAVLGGLLGYFAFFWFVGYGLYALILPGFLVGLGFAVGFRGRSIAGGVVCGLAAVALGIFTEWKYAPFKVDGSLEYFLTHLHSLTRATQIMIGVGGLISFWYAKGRNHGDRRRRVSANTTGNAPFDGPT